MKSPHGNSGIEGGHMRTSFVLQGSAAHEKIQPSLPDLYRQALGQESANSIFMNIFNNGPPRDEPQI
jgi:hypothetical protein